VTPLHIYVESYHLLVLSFAGALVWPPHRLTGSATKEADKRLDKATMQHGGTSVIDNM
jgi:hypothetical protein